MPKHVYSTGFVVGKQFAVKAAALPFRLLSEHLDLASPAHRADGTITPSLRVHPELKGRLMIVAAESRMTIQTIECQALEIELLAHEELLVGEVEREEQIRRRVRSGEAHH